jgi:DNA polymerase (family 10)
MIDKLLLKILRDISKLLQLKGENIFKARAYENAADLIESQNIDVHELYKNNTLNTIDGFGDALVSKISDYCLNGKMAYYENLKDEVPIGLINIAKVNGIGATKARLLYYEQDIKGLDELLDKCESGELAKIKGFGAKSITQIIGGIYSLKEVEGRLLQDAALDYAEQAFYYLKSLEVISKIASCGDLQKGAETLDSISFLISLNNGYTKEDLLNSKLEYKVYNDNSNLYYLNDDGVKVNLFLADKDSFYWELHKLNSSEEYHTAFEEMLRFQGYSINEKIHKDNLAIEFTNDDDIYKKLGLTYVPIEIRQEAQTVQFANQGMIPTLITEADMQGMLHCHSTYSDGKHSLRDMALATKALGYKYFAICDHSKTAVYAGGLSIEDVRKQHKEIDELNNENLGIRILKGIESDILTDGSLDYPDEILATFDIVVASVHSGFNLSKEDMTRRLIAALKNPFTTILGHPTGRKLLKRNGYDVDLKEVIRVAKEEGKVIEINANPKRLDIDTEHALYAKQIGTKIAINPDAHSTAGLKLVKHGITIARRAWLEPSNVINTLPYSEFVKQYCRKNG